MASNPLEGTAVECGWSEALSCVVPPLLRAALGGGIPDVAADDILTHLPALMAWCEGQQLIPMVTEGLLHLPAVAAAPASTALMARAGAYAAHSECQSAAARRISDGLEAAGVRHMPLKGLVLKPLYPYPEWRCMGDVDILISSADKERATEVLSAMGCTAGVESDHECHFRTREGVHIELHKSLVPTYDTDLYAYFSDGFSRARLSEGRQYGMTLSDEDTYIYLVAHMAKHYRAGGVGVRYAVDLYVFRTSCAMDEGYLARELDTLGLGVFEACVRRLSLWWFEGQAADAAVLRMNRFLFSGGVFGDAGRAELSLGARLSETGREARRARLGRLLFPSYATLRRQGHSGGRWRLPLWWSARWWKLLTTRRAHCRDTVRALRVINDEATAALTAELSAVGLSLPRAGRKKRHPRENARPTREQRPTSRPHDPTVLDR